MLERALPPTRSAARTSSEHGHTRRVPYASFESWPHHVYIESARGAEANPKDARFSSESYELVLHVAPTAAAFAKRLQAMPFDVQHAIERTGALETQGTSSAEAGSVRCASRELGRIAETLRRLPQICRFDTLIALKAWALSFQARKAPQLECLPGTARARR
jgi:hypothetical protein